LIHNSQLIHVTRFNQPPLLQQRKCQQCTMHGVRVTCRAYYGTVTLLNRITPNGRHWVEMPHAIIVLKLTPDLTCAVSGEGVG